MPAKRLVMSAAAVVVVVVALASPGFAQQPRNCQPFAGSLTASLDVFAAEPGWYGTAFLTFGDTAPVKVALRDIQLDRLHPQQPNEKGLWGAEKYVFVFGTGDELEMAVDFMGMFGSTPTLAQYNASGKVIGGTGQYANASGNVTAHGPFILALPPLAFPPLGAWIAELKGTVCGVQ